MPVQILRLEAMDEDGLMREVLDKFVNCHEQTYEEFLNTFTHLSKEMDVTRGGAHGTSSSTNIFTSVKIPPKNESNGHHLRDATVSLCTSSQCSEEEQVVIHAGQEDSSSVQGGQRLAGKVKVNSFLDLEDLDMDEESEPQMSTDTLLLPGEVEQEISTSVPACAPCVDQPRTSEAKPKPTAPRTQKQTEEILGDEVQPFSLDEEFDYDNVALTPKFTFEEIETIKELSKQKRQDTNLD